MSNKNEEITIKELFDLLKNLFHYYKRYTRQIFILTLFSGIVGLAYSYLKNPNYTASLTFALEEKSPAAGAGGLSSIASSFGLNLGGAEGGAFTGDNILELMKSKLLVEKTLLTKINDNDSDLILDRYIKFNNLKEKWSENNSTNNIKFNNLPREKYSREHDSILTEIHNVIIKEMLDVSKLDKKLSIIQVNVKSKDEIFAKLFCENLVKNVTDFYIETKTSKSRKNVLLLESRVDSVKRELDNAMYGRASFTDQNMGLIRQSAAVPKLKQELRVQMLGTMYGELVKNLEFSKLALMREEPLIQIIDTPRYPLFKESIGKIKATLLGFVFGGIIVLLMLTVRYFVNQIK